jgi:hypothetical protein
MTSLQLDHYFRRLLDMDSFLSADSAMNGIQVDNSGREIKKIAFAVDALHGNNKARRKCRSRDAFCPSRPILGKTRPGKRPFTERDSPP